MKVMISQPMKGKTTEQIRKEREEVVKQLVEEMKGTVTIDNTYKDGFRLVVKLKR